MTEEEFVAEMGKASAFEIGRATVALIRNAATLESFARMDGKTALLIVADCLEKAVEDRTL